MDGFYFASFVIGILVAAFALNYVMQRSIKFRFLLWDCASISVVLELLVRITKIIMGV